MQLLGKIFVHPLKFQVASVTTALINPEGMALQAVIGATY